MPGSPDGSRAARFVLDTPADTARLGACLALSVVPGLAVLLEGELGAGKTTLVREMCRSLGWKRTRSPSFALVNEYARARIPVAHADLYRLGNADARDLGLDEYIDDGWVVVVEWPERLIRADFPDLWRCRLSVESGGARVFTATADGERALAALARLEGCFA